MDFSSSAKFLAAEARLPEQLRSIYRQFVEEYAFHTNVRYGRGYVAYEVLADLVQAGWRPSVGLQRELKEGQRTVDGTLA